MIELGDLIKKEREKNKLSVRALSELSGISHTEIHRIENGERKTPSPENLKKLSEALQLSYESLSEIAGYSAEERYERFIGLENKFRGIMLSELTYQGWVPIENKRNKNDLLFDLILMKGNFKWVLEFKHITNHRIGTDTLNRFIGRVIISSSNVDKVSIVIDNPEVFKNYLHIHTSMVNFEFSIILIDFENFRIIEEYVFNK